MNYRKGSIRIKLKISLFLFFSCLGACFAVNRIVDVNQGLEKDSFLVPYPFYNESIGLAAGAAFGSTGKPQEQSTMVGTAFGSTNGSWGLYLLGFDFQMPFEERLFLDPWISIGNFENLKSYSDGNPLFPYQRAGNHDSDQYNFIEGTGTDQNYEFKFKYLLPIGLGTDEVIHTYETDRGLLVSRPTNADPWNPLEGGRTYVEVKPFYRIQDIKSIYDNSVQKTNGVKFSLFHDNRDFTRNPSRGSTQRISFSRDWGLFDSTNPWTVLEAEFSKYFSLGRTENLRQQVLALNMWTADALTWKSDGFENGKEVFKGPPSYAGASLGGLFRMRGYPTSRFNDKAAMYYTAEYRFIPEWNPFDNWQWAESLKVNWIQGVVFAEVGRVAEKWSVSKLHSRMKWDAGVGLRAWAQNIVIRVDTAFSDEGVRVQMMVAHPF